MFFVCYKKNCICKGISLFLLSVVCIEVNAIPEKMLSNVALYFLYANGLFNKESEQNKVEYSYLNGCLLC